jgi:hypothetical protein
VDGENCIMKRFSRYCKVDKIKEETMDGKCSTQGDKRNVYKILVGKSEGNRPLGKYRLTIRWGIILKLILNKCGETM